MTYCYKNRVVIAVPQYKYEGCHSEIRCAVDGILASSPNLAALGAKRGFRDSTVARQSCREILSSVDLDH